MSELASMRRGLPCSVRVWRDKATDGDGLFMCCVLEVSSGRDWTQFRVFEHGQMTDSR